MGRFPDRYPFQVSFAFFRRLIMLYSARWKTISITIFEFLTSDEIQEASAVGSIAILLSLALVFGASKLIGKSMADLFR